MSRRTGLVLVFSLCAIWARAQDWSAFVAASNRSDDGLILEILRDADFETSARMLEALGSRKDPYAQDILSWLLSRFSKTTEYQTELLIRLTVKALFDDAPNDMTVRDRLQANVDFVDALVKNISKFHDPQLKGSIVRLLLKLGGTNRLPALMEVGAGIIEALNQTAGHISAQDTGLAYDYLAAVLEIGNTDFMEPCLAIARLSRDPDLTLKARQVARHLTASAP